MTGWGFAYPRIKHGVGYEREWRVGGFNANTPWKRSEVKTDW